ncbi:MAG: transcriptional regulator [Woeseiaceae bacterium]|nr:transcriptional regulator [Woeseiaceae bacterium]
MSGDESDLDAAAIAGSMAELDKLLEHRLRLALCVLLARFDSLSFSKLKALTKETDGNLGANLRRLEDARYLNVRKTHVDRKPVTWYSLSARGKRALSAHVDALSGLIGGVDG